jgi:hypothetical protein
VSALAGDQTEIQHDAAFASAAVAEKKKIFLSRQILAAGQFQHQRLVERGDGQEIETIEALDHRESGLPDAALGGTTLAV